MFTSPHLSQKKYIELIAAGEVGQEYKGQIPEKAALHRGVVQNQGQQPTYFYLFPPTENLGLDMHFLASIL